jgi:asparagine synthase (glutamine-hydrolysing)
MCGITGYVDTGVSKPGRRLELDAAVAALRHRGPNDRGVWCEDHDVGLGHTRLSILDLSPLGHQPMVSHDGRQVMVFNGEVYNFRTIRRELEALGHRFRSDGDSEVVLAALVTWGIRAIDRFIGMFAIALWSRPTRTLTLIRDRLGVKPLYFAWHGRCLCFGSEVKALHAYRHWTADVDPAAMGEFFQFGYINAPRSIYRNVYKLPPAHYLVLREGSDPHVQRYWSVLDAMAQDGPVSTDDRPAAKRLHDLMADAFELRMVADVPVGIFLSGGVDSSTVTAILRRQGHAVHTFTVGMGAEELNEMPYARAVAAHLQTRHTEQTLQASDGKAILATWGSLFDEPFFDSSGIPTFLVSKMASQHVKVVLSADGGDELFGGYNVYASVLSRLARVQSMTPGLRRTAWLALQALPLDLTDSVLSGSPLSSALRFGPLARLRRVRNALYAPDPAAVYDQAISIWSPDEIRSLTGAYTRVREPITAYPGDPLDQMCFWDLHNYLPGDILTKVDRASMAVSIEGREPFLDHRLVEFAMGLPHAYRRGALGPKHLLKRVLYDYVPRELIDRPKQGFAIPLLSWLRGDLAYLLDEYLTPARLREHGLLDERVVARTMRAFRRGDDRLVHRVWSLLAFQMWRSAW